VHPVFKTESPELRQAIEQNWAGFRSAANERGLQISTPVFESTGGEGAFNSFGSRDQSNYQPGGDPGEASDAEAQQVSPLPGLVSGGNQQTVTQPLAASTTGSSVQMYA